MKRSAINELFLSATECFREHGWALPPEPRWDGTDFGLRDRARFGLVLINLAEEPEYCEKLMYARQGMTTPAHTQKKKKEDILCRAGVLEGLLWKSAELKRGEALSLKVSGKMNDDLTDNFFVNPDIGRFPGVEEEAEPLVKMVRDRV
jgi:D-lyxose ketol-isomerase